MCEALIRRSGLDLDSAYEKGLLDILTRGDHYIYGERTKSQRLSATGGEYVYELENGDGDPTVPMPTTKYVNSENVVAELTWFMRGKTNIKYLEDRGVGIWTPNAFDQYVDREGWDVEQGDEDWSQWLNWFKGMIKADEGFAAEHGDLGKVYGAMWRDFPGPGGESVDQLGRHVQELREGKQSTRHVVNAWHPSYVDEVALPPCHVQFQLHNRNGRLDVTLTQRSTDAFLGEPYNITSYSLLDHILANDAGLKPGQLRHFHGNHHLYCGAGRRAAWYADEDNRRWLRESVKDVVRGGERSGFKGLKETLEDRLPPESAEMRRSDHVPLALEQLSRQPYSDPTVSLPAGAAFGAIDVEDVVVDAYDHHAYIPGRMAV